MTDKTQEALAQAEALLTLEHALAGMLHDHAMYPQLRLHEMQLQRAQRAEAALATLREALVRSQEVCVRCNINPASICIGCHEFAERSR
jgi:hypothetical protein